MQIGYEDVGWIRLAQGMNQWWVLVDTVMNHRIPWKVAKVLTNWATIGFTRNLGFSSYCSELKVLIGLLGFIVDVVTFFSSGPYHEVCGWKWFPYTMFILSMSPAFPSVIFYLCLVSLSIVFSCFIWTSCYQYFSSCFLIVSDTKEMFPNKSKTACSITVIWISIPLFPVFLGR